MLIFFSRWARILSPLRESSEDALGCGEQSVGQVSLVVKPTLISTFSIPNFLVFELKIIARLC